MQVILMSPYEDNSFQEVLIVEHADENRTYFKEEFEYELEKTKKENPEEWQLNDILNILEEKGWSIIKPHTFKITY